METGSGSCLSDRNIKIVFVCALSHRCSWRSPGRRYIRISGISVHPGHFLQNKTRRGRTMSEVKNKKKKSSMISGQYWCSGSYSGYSYYYNDGNCF